MGRLPRLPFSLIAPSFCRQHHIRSLSVFTSALRADFRMDGDIDLLVEFESGVPVGFLTLSCVQREPSALLGRPVDLVPHSGLTPVIRDAVLSSTDLLYAA